MSAAGEMSVAAETSAAALRTGSLFQALRRVVVRHFSSPEDEIARAIVRAFAEFAREIRK